MASPRLNDKHRGQASWATVVFVLVILIIWSKVPQMNHPREQQKSLRSIDVQSIMQYTVLQLHIPQDSRNQLSPGSLQQRLYIIELDKWQAWDCTMESCHINFMYVNSGIDKSLDVSISLTKQIPHKVQTEGLLCSYYPSGTAADRVGYFPQCQSVTPLRDPRGVCSKVGVLGKVLRYWLRKSVRSLKSSTRGIGHTWDFGCR